MRLGAKQEMISMSNELKTTGQPRSLDGLVRSFAVATTMTRYDHNKVNIMTALDLVTATSTQEAKGIHSELCVERFPDSQIFTQCIIEVQNSNDVLTVSGGRKETNE
jgi:hypothetical protein